MDKLIQELPNWEKKKSLDQTWMIILKKIMGVLKELIEASME